MKKFLFLLFISLFAVVFFGCHKEKTPVERDVESTTSTSDYSYTQNQKPFYSEKEFFTLNYEPLLPEEPKAAGKIDMTQGVSGSTQKNESVVPGLRKITDYKTAYYTDKTVSGQKQPVSTSQEFDKSKAPKEDFTIVDWGPSKIPADVKCPSFYVMFSEPVVSLSALSEQSNQSEYMKIEPPLKGVFRWYGTSLLSFDASEAANPLQSYKITVSDNVKSVYGKKIKGSRTFSTQAEALKIFSTNPGYKFSRKNNMWFSKDDVPFEAANECRVIFNYDVKAEELQKNSTVTYAGQTVPFTVTQENPNTVTYNLTLPKIIESRKEIQISVSQPEGQGVPARTSYSTLKDFNLGYMSVGETNNRFSNPVYLSFSHPVDENTVAQNIETVPEMRITKDNIKVSGSSVTVYNLPVTFGERYRLYVGTGIKDVYGRSLVSEKSYSIDVPNAASEVHFNNSGMNILEAQFPHKLVFDYQNIESGSYRLAQTDRPFDSEEGYSSVEVNLKKEPLNQRIMELVDLDSVLPDNGTDCKKGWVRFSADTVLSYNSRQNGTTVKKTYERSNSTRVQITDLGVTVRYGINRAVVLVTSLSTGKPVENATVYYGSFWRDASKEKMENDSIAKGITNADGLAVLDTGMDFIRDPIVLVEKDDDAVAFEPSSHSPWRNGIYNYSYYIDTDAEPVTFIFTDRGLYKPGETVSFRGIDRDLRLGTYSPREGNYTIKLQDDYWYNARVYSQQSGVTTKNGGFSGSFVLPEDLDPGEYVLGFCRDGEIVQRCYFTIAHFERLKFQSSVSMPSTPLSAGDTLQASLKATYLAGGALSDASYYSSWVREPWYFTSDAPEFKNFKFGPIYYSDNREHVSDDNGSLNVEGEAKLSITASQGSLKGVPYRYRVSAEVTDASGQAISANGSSVVHSSLYYMGLAKAGGSSGFAKSGEKLTFDYLLSDLEGTPLTKAAAPEKLLASLAGDKKDINVTLSREYWNLVQQNGVYGGVYTRYEKSIDVEEEKTVQLSTKGKIEVTPKKSGYYTLTAKSTDAKGRDVITELRFFVTGKGVPSWAMDDASSIRLTPDQSEYNPGDTAHILMESTLPSGNYLITVEREGIFTQEVKHFDEGIAVIDIPIAQNYVPVFYVSISSYSVRSGAPTHQYGEADLDKPKGYYGVTEVRVNPYVKAFSIDVKSDKMAYRPGEEATVTLTATKGGKPVPNAELTLLAVDRGVLDLIDYHVPNPIEFFYNRGRFNLGVWGGDSREYLMDPVTYEVKNLQGGDEGESDEKMEERKDWNPTAVFEPVLITDKNGKVTCKFKLPDTLTTYRVTAFGVCGELLALQEEEIGVKNPVNVQQVLPRRMRERDTAELGVLLTNLDGVAHDITVSCNLRTPDASEIESEDGVSKKPGSAFVDGATEHKVKVHPGQNVTVYFDAAAVKAGVVNVEFTVKSDIVNEKVICPLVIEKPYLYETFTSMDTVSSDEKSRQFPITIPESIDDAGSLTLTLDASRLGTLGDAVKYVFEYPYGCMEQQSARILPLVIFEDYIDVFDMEKADGLKDVRKLVKSYMKKWKKVQHSSGGFPYWPDGNSDNFYVSTRIAHIAALEKQRGYSDNDIAINVEKLLNYLDKASSSRYISDYDRAYYYYVMTLLGRTVPVSKLESQFAQNKDISITALTGMTYLNLNGMDSGLSEKCRDRIISYMRPTTRGVDISSNSNDWYYSWYNSNTDRYALALQFLVQMDSESEWVTRLIHQLLENQKKGYWTSTATTAKVLDSMYTVIKTSGLDKLNQKSKVSIDGNELVSGTFKGPGAKPVTVEIPLKDARLSGLKKNEVIPMDVEKEGNGALYFTQTLRYAIPYENAKSRDEGLGLTMKITDLISGEEIKPSEGSNIIELESGRVYTVKVRLSTTRDRNFIAMRAPVPSGAEILDSTFVTSSDDAYSGTSYDEEYSWGHWMSNQSILDNEIQFFWDHFRKGETTAEFKFRAVRRGVYPTPSVQAECMYEPEIFGRTDGYLFTIK